MKRRTGTKELTVMMERIRKLENELRKIYKSVNVNGDNCFAKKTGEIFHLFGIKDFNALGIEYAENMNEAKKNVYEDGDLFYINDMNEEEMLAAMVREIEDE